MLQHEGQSANVDLVLSILVILQLVVIPLLSLISSITKANSLLLIPWQFLLQFHGDLYMNSCSFLLKLYSFFFNILGTI